MDDDKALGERLKFLRDKQGLRQEDVAKAVGITKSTYSNIETGYSSSTKLQTAIKLAKFFNVSLDFLIGLKDNDVLPDGSFVFDFADKGDRGDS